MPELPWTQLAEFIGMTPRVLILTEYGVLNGGENSLLSVLDRLLPRWQFEAVVPADSALAEEFAARGIPQHGIQFRDPRGQRLPQPEIRRQLAGLDPATLARSDPTPIAFR